jgi:hypothetical protein
LEGRVGNPAGPDNPAEIEMLANGPAFPSIEMVRLPRESLDRLVRSTGQILTESLRQKAVTEELAKVGRQTAEMETEWSRFRKAAAGPLRRMAANPEFASITGTYN